MLESFLKSRARGGTARDGELSVKSKDERRMQGHLQLVAKEIGSSYSPISAGICMNTEITCIKRIFERLLVRCLHERTFGDLQCCVSVSLLATRACKQQKIH